MVIKKGGIVYNIWYIEDKYVEYIYRAQEGSSGA